MRWSESTFFINQTDIFDCQGERVVGRMASVYFFLGQSVARTYIIVFPYIVFIIFRRPNSFPPPSSPPLNVFTSIEALETGF